MSSGNKKILIGVGAGVAVIVVALIFFLLGRSSSDNKTVTAASTPATTVTFTRTVTATAPANRKSTSAGDTSQASPASSHGPYFTMNTAVNYVESQQGGMQTISPGTTWQTGATLHVIRATPTGGASYGGDFYYFFVDGYPVGEYTFTSAQSDQAVDSTTFAVTFNVFLPDDPHCCPTGGISTVQFYWDGSSLTPSGSMQGATM